VSGDRHQEALREVGDGVHWLCGCLEMMHQGTVIHSYVAGYLVVGGERTLMVDTGHPSQWAFVDAKLQRLLAGRPLDFVFPTHPELPHAGNLPRLLQAHPDCRVVGDVRDLHLYLPEYEHRLMPMAVGDGVDLGGRTFSFQEAIVRDLTNTLWGFDDGAKVLFVSDGFGFSHYHGTGDCGRIAEELDEEVSTEQVAFLNDQALAWIRYTDLRPILARARALVEALDVRAIAPAHGAVVGDVAGTFPTLIDKLLQGRTMVPRTERTSAATGR
jgi:flavorubredoxin